MKNILVIGGAGYIGSHMCKHLATNGYTPVVLDKPIVDVYHIGIQKKYNTKREGK